MLTGDTDVSSGEAIVAGYRYVELSPKKERGNKNCPCMTTQTQLRTATNDSKKDDRCSWLILQAFPSG